MVTLDGFWVGQRCTVRLWVELVGPGQVLHIVKGDLLTFTGTLTGNGANYPGRVGVTVNTGAKLLTAGRAHVDVDTTALGNG